MSVRDGWEDPDPAEVVYLADDRDWKTFERRLSNNRPKPWRRCLEVARAGGAQTAVVETRYIDADYRAEYSEHYSKTFAATPDSARRVHFFTKKLDPATLWRLPDNAGYLGFVVLRPSNIGQVGRTMLRPPPDLAHAVTCTVRAEVTFFGQRIYVEAVPFVQQDYQVGRCAQAAAWMCHYSAALRGDVERQPTAAFTIAADDNQTMGRPVPSSGLTAQQLTNLLRDLDLAPILYQIGNLPGPDMTPIGATTAAIPVICRFLNSGYPVVICTDGHAFSLVGYRRHRRRDNRDWFSFIRHDDSLGPYLVVDDIENDRPDPNKKPHDWRYVLAPVPDRLWLAPEAAEHRGRYELLALDDRVSQDRVARSETLTELEEAGRLTFRTYATTASRFKEFATSRRLNDDLAAEYRYARLSRLVWVVEAIDKQRRNRGNASVMGEVVFDGTSSSEDPAVLAMRVPGAALVFQTDDTERYLIEATDRPTLSAAVTEPHEPAGERWSASGSHR